MLLGTTLILAIILTGLVLFFFRPPTALVLPLSAIAIGTIAYIPAILKGELASAFSAILTRVVANGMGRLTTAILAVILGAVIAEILSDAGVTSRVLTVTAEFSGDSVFFLTLALLLITALLFTNIGGLGAVIMVATTVVPVMLAIGLDKLTAGGVFLLGLSLGGVLNPVNWQFYISILELKSEDIIPFALALFGVFLIISIIFIIVRIQGSIGFRRAEVSWLVFILAALCTVAFLLFKFRFLLDLAKLFLFNLLALILGLMLLGLVMRFIVAARALSRRVNVLSIGAFIFPVLLILFVNLGNSVGTFNNFSLDITSALFLGVIFAYLSTFVPGRGETTRLMRALYEGFRLAIPAILLLLGIGMLLEATTLPEVGEAVQPIILRIVPTSAIGYVLFFILLSPLALYRGPLNLYGMGSGIMGLMLGAATLSPQLLMGAFFSVGMMQGVCDPTNTHNAWLAGFLGVKVIDLTKATFFFVAAIVLVGLVCAQAIF